MDAMSNAEHDRRTEKELLALARSGDGRALDDLCARYAPECRRLARRYADSFMDQEDLAQEGMLGLVQAIRRYDPLKGVPFQHYSRLCMVSKMLSALEAGARLKRKAEFFSLSGALPDSGVTLEEDLMAREEALHKNKQIQSLLSRSEKEALRLYLRGCTYAQIAAQLEVSQKSVDNALQRVRRKLRAAFWPEGRCP